MPLKIKIKANERIIINGAVLTALVDTAFLVNNKANMLLERQIMRPDQADSPARRIYFAVQCAYMADPEELPACLAHVTECVHQYEEATASDKVHKYLEEIKQLTVEARYYDALKIVNRHLIPYDDLMLGRVKPAQKGQSSGAD